MERNVPGNEVLVQGRIKLFEKIDPSRLQHAGDFSKRRTPVLYMVEYTEAKNGIQ